MRKRFVSIWFRHLKTDWFTRRHPDLRDVPFVLAAPDHGRMLITAGNAAAQKQGIMNGMVLADARAIMPGLQFFDDQPELPSKLLTGIAEWCIRYSPVVAVDLPEGLILDVSGCAHLWGGEKPYLTEMYKRINGFGYNIHIAIADTIGTAWAIARYGRKTFLIGPGEQYAALQPLPPAALRIESVIIERLEKLGLRHISEFINMPRPALRRRFGMQLLDRLDEALGHKTEGIQPVQPIEPYHERLPCIEPIVTATGIEIALQKLLDILCNRLKKEEKGLRTLVFKGYRVDGKIEQISIGTNRPTRNSKHLFRLFEIKISSIEPALGIELFILEASGVEDLSPVQEKLFGDVSGLDDNGLSELLDRISGKLGTGRIQRYVPDEHYWPERSYKPAGAINEKLKIAWKAGRPRPLQVLQTPHEIEVTAPIPDYPPMNFRYKGKLHKIIKADGPERIEQEWWLQDGRHRDYYYVEDEDGCRYWLFRLGHYDTARSYKWFIHGFFA